MEEPLKRSFLICFNICQLVNNYTLYVYAVDSESELLYKIPFFLVYTLSRFNASSQYIQCNAISIIENVLLLDFTVFDKNLPTYFKKFEFFQLLFPCLFMYVIEVCGRDNINLFYIFGIVSPILLTAHEIFYSWISAIEATATIVLTYEMKDCLIEQFGPLLSSLFFILEVVLIIVFYIWILKVKNIEDIGYILIGYFLSCFFGFCVVSQKLNRIYILNTYYVAFLIEVQGFAYLNNLIIILLLFNYLNVYIQMLAILSLPIILYQIYILMNYLINGPFKIKRIIDLSNSEQLIQQLQSSQYQVEFIFQNFEGDKGRSYLQSFLAINPNVYYTIRIEDNLNKYPYEGLSSNHGFPLFYPTEFNIYTSSEENLKFFVSAFYLSDFMVINTNLFVDYHYLHSQFPPYEVDRIIIDEDVYQTKVFHTKRKAASIPSQVMISYYQSKFSTLMLIIAFNKEIQSYLSINPHIVLYDLFEG